MEGEPEETQRRKATGLHFLRDVRPRASKIAKLPRVMECDIMNNPKRLAVVIVAVACACSTQKYHWTHAEKDSEQFDVDNSYCLAQTRGTRAIARLPMNQEGQYSGTLSESGTFSSGLDTVATVEVMEVQKTMHRRCMKRKGWRLEAE